ncbi:LysR family transcriptional regulator [Liquorilactobacillus oeni]|uniref:Malolactic regulator n=1 Tax=Liquorilactobacillus oeni DSM 19972 TaxID=1423777 RepID=A0A0R1MM17_9LACO|nr:LysR family transcriptional regulator [Liquorilactobacillus oeni]KRL05627.1 malolactic regulator [Liquorilactobacillus oeni DSM 19972]
MNTRDLEYFICLTKIKNFSKVAQKFGVSQPTISFALQRLENELGAKLIIRHRAQRQLIITECGQQLLQHAQDIMLHCQWLLHEIEDERQKKLSLGLPPIIENNYFPQVAKNLKTHGLLNKIQTLEYGSKTTLKALQTGEVDLALLGSIDPLNDKEIITEEFDRQPFVVYVSQNHPLAKKKTVYFSDLKDEDFVLFKDGFVHNHAFNLLTTRNHFHPHVVFRSNGSHTLVNLVADGVGIGFLTAIIQPFRTDVVRLELLDQDAPMFVTNIAYRRSHVFNKLQQRILDSIRQTLVFNS